MDVPQGLAERVAGLRQRLQAMLPAGREGGPAVSPQVAQLAQVTRQLSQLKGTASELDFILPDAPGENGGPPTLPGRLTWRTRRLLLRGRELLDQLRELAPWLPDADTADPVVAGYHETLAMAELLLRAVQVFPDTATDQLRLCDGLEGMLDSLTERWGQLAAILARRKGEAERVDLLGQDLFALVQGRPIRPHTFRQLAEALVNEIHDATPLRWMTAPNDRPDQRAAAHALNVANVLIRVLRHDGEWRGRLAEAVLAALLMDAGMTALPADVLNHPGQHDEDQRRMIEAHVGLSVEAVRRLLPEEGWLSDVVLAHHERMDGTGYPTGLAGPMVPRLARLLAACDTYAALASPRPHRAALTPRAALTETLLEAEKGRLDTALVEQLLALSFYPVGTPVELSNGQLGYVVATNWHPYELAAPARPVVCLLTTAEGQPLPWPEHLNLAQAEGRHIVRGMTAAEARSCLGLRFGEAW